MRYRKLDDNLDMVWGHGLRDYHKDSIEGVAQAIYTRLMLFQGEFYLNTSSGMPWGQFPISQQSIDGGKVLGRTTQPDRDLAIRMEILDTQGVLSVIDYESSFDGNTRAFRASATVNTIYGKTTITIPASVSMSKFGLFYSPMGGGKAL
jgi:hypothetical protein